MFLRLQYEIGSVSKNAACRVMAVVFDTSSEGMVVQKHACCAWQYSGVVETPQSSGK